MTVNSRSQKPIGLSANKANSIFLSRGESHLESFSASKAGSIRGLAAIIGVGTIDEAVRNDGKATIYFAILPALKRGFVTPVCQEQGPQVLVVICCGRSVDNDWTGQSIYDLNAKMRVIPALKERLTKRIAKLELQLTVPYCCALNLYVMFSPGGIGHCVTPEHLRE
jgi:hypothetical protein